MPLLCATIQTLLNPYVQREMDEARYHLFIFFIVKDKKNLSIKIKASSVALLLSYGGVIAPGPRGPKQLGQPYKGAVHCIRRDTIKKGYLAISQ